MRHLNNGTDHRHSKSCCDQSSPARRTIIRSYADRCTHYVDVIMNAIVSQITSLMIVYSTVYSDADQSKHQSSASLAFVWGIHRDRWIPRTKGQLRGKCFNLMRSSWGCPICIALALANVSNMSDTTIIFHSLYIVSVHATKIWANEINRYPCNISSHWLRSYSRGRGLIPSTKVISPTMGRRGFHRSI